MKRLKIIMMMLVVSVVSLMWCKVANADDHNHSNGKECPQWDCPFVNGENATPKWIEENSACMIQTRVVSDMNMLGMGGLEPVIYYYGAPIKIENSPRI